MIYDFTDGIFAWRGWQIIKWIFGALLVIGVVYIIWIINTNPLFISHSLKSLTAYSAVLDKYHLSF